MGGGSFLFDEGGGAVNCPQPRTGKFDYASSHPITRSSLSSHPPFSSSLSFLHHPSLLLTPPPPLHPSPTITHSSDAPVVSRKCEDPELGDDGVSAASVAPTFEPNRAGMLYIYQSLPLSLILSLPLYGCLYCTVPIALCLAVVWLGYVSIRP